MGLAAGDRQFPLGRPGWRVGRVGLTMAGAFSSAILVCLSDCCASMGEPVGSGGSRQVSAVFALMGLITVPLSVCLDRALGERWQSADVGGCRRCRSIFELILVVVVCSPRFNTAALGLSGSLAVSGASPWKSSGPMLYESAVIWHLRRTSGGPDVGRMQYRWRWISGHPALVTASLGFIVRCLADAADLLPRRASSSRAAIRSTRAVSGMGRRIVGERIAIVGRPWRWVWRWPCCCAVFAWGPDDLRRPAARGGAGRVRADGRYPG